MTDHFTPQKIDMNLYRFTVESTKCVVCRNEMVHAPSTRNWRKTTFPSYIGNNFEAQAKKAGLELSSDIKVDREYICNKCENEGKADFLCSLCGQRHSVSKVKEQIGDPPEFLCLQCYTTVPAKEWDDKITSLNNEHRYDFN